MANLIKPYTNISSLFEKFDMLYGETTKSQKERYQNCFLKFKSLFDCDSAYVASSSGRVEVCGNHTDHNGGKVVSCAVSLDMLAFFLPTENGIITVNSEGHGVSVIDCKIKQTSIKKGTTASLILGVVNGLKDRGYKVGGFNAYVNSTVLGGAGISSSAAFEVLICEILNFLYNDGQVSKEENAKISQFAENEYFGKPCGMLDQTAIAFGGLKKLDFSNTSKIGVSDIKCDLSNYTLVLINTGGSHADLTDEYASIPREMKEVAKAFRKERLIEVDEREFFENIAAKSNGLSDRAVLRAIHFFEENNRVDGLEIALKNNDYKTFLKYVHESGISSLCKLQNCYVSGKTEQPIPKALSLASKYLVEGANRVHGGGFAGTILNIINNDFANEFICQMTKIFGSDFVIPLKVRSVGVIVL